MVKMLPDRTFYPSAALAAESPAEGLAYVALLAAESNGTTRGQTDAIGVVDVNPASPEYGQLVGKVDFPQGGNELHHFGWNACSSHLCGYAPNPHMERRYLVVPGTHSSRIHIVDTKPDPRQPRLVKVIEGEEVMQKTGYAAPHTVHCGPDGIYMNALGNPSGDGPGGIFTLDHETFEVKGAWEKDRGPQQLSYDFWWHLGQDTMITSEWGTPNMVKDGVNPELLLGGKYGNALHVWDLKRRTHLQRIDLGASSRWRSSFDRRTTRASRTGLSALSSASRTSRARFRGIATRRPVSGPRRKSSKSRRSPRTQQTCPTCSRDSGGAAAGDRHQPLARRPLLYVSCWGTGEAVRRDRPVCAEADRQRADWDRAARGASEER